MRSVTDLLGNSLGGEPRHGADRVLRVHAHVGWKDRRVGDVEPREIVRFELGGDHAARRLRTELGRAEKMGSNAMKKAGIVG